MIPIVMRNLQMELKFVTPKFELITFKLLLLLSRYQEVGAETKKQTTIVKIRMAVVRVNMIMVLAQQQGFGRGLKSCNTLVSRFPRDKVTRRQTTIDSTEESPALPPPAK
jgi:hypothetical protein